MSKETIIETAVNTMRNNKISDLYNELLLSSPEFILFVESNKDLTTDEIIKKYELPDTFLSKLCKR